MKKLVICALLLLIGLAACQPIRPSATPAPPTIPLPTSTETPMPPTPTETPIPTATPTPPLSAVGGPALVSIHMFSPLRGWGVIENALLTTHDGGVNWASVPVADVVMDNYTEMFFLSAEIVYVLPRASEQIGRLYATRDGGGTWTSLPTPFSSAKLFFVDDNIGFAFQTLGADSTRQEVAIFQTLDRGAIWTQVFSHKVAQTTANLPEAGLKTGMSFIDPGKGWIGLADAENEIGLHRAEDAGRTWVKQAMLAPVGLASYTATAHPPFVFPANAQDAILAVDFSTPGADGKTRTFYVSHDAGVTWAQAGSVPDGTVYTFLDPQTGWAWGGHSLYFTSDAAQTWIPLPVAFSRTERATCINFIDQNNGWLIATDSRNRVHLYRSYDGGNTWTAIVP